MNRLTEVIARLCDADRRSTDLVIEEEASMITVADLAAAHLVAWQVERLNTEVIPRILKVNRLLNPPQETRGGSS